jgi:hypothetical protein
MKRVIVGIIGLSLCFFIFQCGTTPQESEPAAEPEGEPTPAALGTAKFDTSAITASINVLADGFSPNGDEVKDDISFEISASQADRIKKWKIEMTSTSSGVQKTISGDGVPPESLVWDGKKNGGLADDGLYNGVLTLDYINGNKPVVKKTGKFTLDNTPPKPSIVAKPLPFSPDGDGRNDSLTITFAPNDISGIDSWKIEIYNEEDELFKTFSGLTLPSVGIPWDGIGDDSTIVEIATDYRAKITITDSCNNTGSAEAKIPVDVLIENNKIMIWAIVFPAYKYDYTKVDANKVRNNRKTLRAIARLLKRYPEYKLRIEGNALMPRSKIDNKKAFDAENKNVLIPLSKNRAEAVKKELVAMGCDPDRIVTVGNGATNPIVPHGDMANRWKNRRVEFFLVSK